MGFDQNNDHQWILRQRGFPTRAFLKSSFCLSIHCHADVCVYRDALNQHLAFCFRRKAETPPSLLDKVRELEAELGPARRKGRKFSLPGNADSAGDAYGSGSQASSQHAHSDADTS